MAGSPSIGLARRHRSRSRHRAADRLVQSQQPSGERAAIGIAHGHDQPRHATSAPRLHRRADRARFRFARGRGAARAELEKGDGGFAGFRADHVLTGEFTVPWELSAGSPNASASSIACWNPSASNRESPPPARSRTSAERRQRQNRSHAKGLCAAAGSIITRPLFLWRHTATTSRPSAFPCAKDAFLPRTDSHRAERVCVVDEDFARRYWPKGGALGQRIVSRRRIPTTRSCSPLSASSAR